MPEGSVPSEPAEPNELRETVIMTTLTLVAGAVDAITFLTMGHVFAALATGNVLFLAFALADGGQVPVARSAVALSAFTVGVAVASFVAHRLVTHRWFPAALVGEAALLGLAGTLALLRHGIGSLAHDPDLVVIAIVALAMGMRAAFVLRAAVPGMPTLLVQMSLVRLLADVVTHLRLPAGREAALQRLARIRLGATVGGMFLGGALGTLMVPWGTGRALIAVAAAVLVLSAVHFSQPRHRPPEAGEQPG
ncbi:YoaK family protein [Streptomyces sp. NBC_00344]|uniref:YoaK family protein n=1 Tax=Streptomyces sp. NBC_00344 TaxID=2975720 RepID=UPI002E1A67A5